MASNDQRRALAETIPTTEVIKDAVTFPRDRLGEPLEISPERFDAWLAGVRAEAVEKHKQSRPQIHIDHVPPQVRYVPMPHRACPRCGY